MKTIKKASRLFPLLSGNSKTIIYPDLTHSVIFHEHVAPLSPKVVNVVVSLPMSRALIHLEEVKVKGGSPLMYVKKFT